MSPSLPSAHRIRLPPSGASYYNASDKSLRSQLAYYRNRARGIEAIAKVSRTPLIQAQGSAAPPEAFDKYRSALDEALKRLVPSQPEGLYRMVRYHLGWADPEGRPVSGQSVGKSLRSTLCFLACEALGCPWSQAVTAAATLELVHNFSLIHDDIQDQDLERRNRPTVWSVWGVGKALWAGNAMRVLADRAATVGGATPHKSTRVAELLTEAYLEMIQGQYMDLDFEARMDIGVDDYIAMVSRKTGALIRCALELGAVLATDSQKTIGAFRRCGAHLGLAFQVRDDMLGIWGDPAATGKPTGNDIRRKKKTFPVAYGLEHATGEDRQALSTVYSMPEVDDAHVDKVLATLARLGAAKQAQALVDHHTEQALETLNEIEVPMSSWGRTQLVDMARFLAYRDR